MERNETGIRKEASREGGGGGGGGSGNGKSGDGFIDRSRVRILLCDNDANSSGEVLTLLRKCSYQVTSVRSARQVIDALNAEGPYIDIILSEVDLPMAKGMKMLKYIMRDKELRRIPVIMMSAQDEVSVVVKCLRLGAADYLVKPLRTNELLNLWTHMWRRRQMLGLAEKNLMNYDFDLVASDPSDANTNSTTLFSDDTDEKSRKSANPEISVTTHQEAECNAAPIEPPLVTASEYRSDVPELVTASEYRSDVPELVTASESRSDVPEISVRRTVFPGQFSSYPKKSALKIGESSAFFTYVKSSTAKGIAEGVAAVDENALQNSSIETRHSRSGGHVANDSQVQEIRKARENHQMRDEFSRGNSVPDSSSERSLPSSVHPEFIQERNSKTEEFTQVHMHPRDGYHHDASGFHYPYYIPGVMNQVMMPSSSAQIYQKNLHDLQNCANPAMLPQYNHIPHCPPHMQGMASYPYYPVNVCLQPGQMRPTQPWPSYGNTTSINTTSKEGKSGKVDRREAALMKFRQKRKERCFDKKIRYVNRKRLAEKRPRVRGQFVRKINGVNVDLNGQPTSGDYDDYEEEEDEEDMGRDSSPENDASAGQ